MTYLAILISLANAYLIARYGRVKFALTLAGSFMLSIFSTAAYFSVAYGENMMTEPIYWGVGLFIALLIYALSNPLRHVIAWLFATIVIVLVVVLPFDLEITAKTLGITAIAAVIPVFIFRKEIKVVLVGLMSGTNLAIGVILLLISLSPISFYESIYKISSVLYLLGAAIGVYFQFKLYERYFPSKNDDKNLPEVP